jgi:hypothetical protein
MQLRISKRTIFYALAIGILLTGGLILFAFSRTWNKTDIEFRIHINEKLVQESTFGEPPTFAIWLEDPNTGVTRTVFVTNRAGQGDWEGKTAVPVALPKWFEVNEAEKKLKNSPDNTGPEQLAISGATPKPGYFSARARVSPGSKWICWIEVNLAGDFNDTFKEYDEVAKTSDDFKTGQPALLYKAAITAMEGDQVKPDIAGICILDPEKGVMVQPDEGITTAKDIFDEISIVVVKPKPRIIEWH